MELLQTQFIINNVKFNIRILQISRIVLQLKQIACLEMFSDSLLTKFWSQVY